MYKIIRLHDTINIYYNFLYLKAACDTVYYTDISDMQISVCETWHHSNE